MSLFICSINSGSNGNCYYVGNGEEAVLIDVGISCREIEKRMLRAGLSMQSLKAIFISHEHSDHIRGVVVLARKYKLPVYITAATLKNSPISLEPELVRSFISNEPVSIGALSITPFLKYHDAIDPYSFVVSGNGIHIGVFTDLGIVCDQLIHHFKQCDAVFLEANYDEEMLENGRYPFYLKKRIRGGKGHLSNRQALELVLKYRTGKLKHLLLSHLSKENNSPELVQELFEKNSGKVKITVASRSEESPVFEIKQGLVVPQRKLSSPGKVTAQMSLF
ncbi:MAG: MBL fold metallo-hydrolase [Bacteroidota bacterium]|nr:MBL fold metallo-hydrolase [Bacteroidota bacterium]